MDFAVILLFVAMVLAPCLVALWGRRDANPRADEEQVQALEWDDTRAEGPLWRMMRRIRRSRPPQHAEPVLEDVPEPEEALPMASASLEELLQLAVEGARVARAAALRADAAANEAAALLAAARTEAAIDMARRARLQASAAEAKASSAKDAYEAALSQAEEAEEAMGLVSDRRAA